MPIMPIKPTPQDLPPVFTLPLPLSPRQGEGRVASLMRG